MTAQAIVEAFIAAWNRGDIDGAFAMMAPDIVWDNIPLGPATGIDACRALMARFPPAEGIDFVVHHIATNGNMVLTERTDRFLIGGRWRDIRLMGIFEIDAAGRIAHWRDYFDMAEFQQAFA